MRRLLVVVGVLAILLVAADVVSRIAIEHQLERRVNNYVPIAAAKVTIHSFPFLVKLAASGRIDKITAHGSNVGQGPFLLDRVDVTVHGVRVNRSRLLNERSLEIVAIDDGTVTADMTQADLQRLAGVPVVLGRGTAELTVAGVAVKGSISIRNGRLRLEAAGLPVSVPIPALPMLPCLSDVRIIPGHLVGSCTFREVPAGLQIALQRTIRMPAAPHAEATYDRDFRVVRSTVTSWT